jgi:hypothetical protein
MFKYGRYLCILILQIIGSSFVFGQDDFEPGYVVTKTGDTLKGLVKDRKTGSFGEIYEKIRFKGEKTRRRYTADDVITYKRGNTKFKSMDLRGEKVFLRVELEGYVSYYVEEIQEQGEQLVLEADYFQKRGTINLVRATQGLFGLKRKTLANFFGDCPPLVKKIDNKQLKHPLEVATFYNQWKKNNP